MGELPDLFAFMLLMVLIGLLPLLVVMTTSFTKISIVLVLLRNALGIQQAPSGMAISGLALAATLLVMAPVWQQISQHVDFMAVMEGKQRPAMTELIEAGRRPLEQFMRKHVAPDELASLSKLISDMHLDADNDTDAPAASQDSEPWLVLVSAFAISEIGAAFKIGMFIAIGFAVIDLIVANLLMAMGMTMFPPSTVSIPLKLLIFVLTMGLSQLMHGLIASYPR
ncbi:EscR/YscR/HrcR family type III secretion system export apparatus protein [Dyella nitratireducens]|nr:EscR/YscR/HrcR family type III secretion system export apparatus protein [Dyella nitratireducens]